MIIDPSYRHRCGTAHQCGTVLDTSRIAKRFPTGFAPAKCQGPVGPRTARTEVRGSARRRGFTLVETVVSTLLVGVVVVAALNTVSASMVGRQKMGDRGHAQLLAQDLMVEILQQAYEEPDDTPIFGRESSENGGSREEYDDVDDYHGWSSSPPEYKDGTEIPNLDGWSRSVSVARVDPHDLPGNVGSDTGVKRIVVTVTRHDATLATLVAVRAGAASNFTIDKRLPVQEF